MNSPTGTTALFQNFSTSTVTGPLLLAKAMATGAQFVVDGSANATATGSLSGNQLISTVVSGTAPLQVRSTTMVPNLNANSLQGYTASYFAMLGANNFTGTQAVSNGNVTASGTARSHTSGNVVVDASGANNGSDYLPGLLFGGTSSGEAIASDRTLYVNPKGLDFYTNATPRISITSIGLVGIGTQNPTHHAMVEVNANNQGSHTTISGGYFEGTSNAGGGSEAADGADFQGAIQAIGSEVPESVPPEDTGAMAARQEDLGFKVPVGWMSPLRVQATPAAPAALSRGAAPRTTTAATESMQRPGPGLRGTAMQGSLTATST